jgi:hypothetical protein
MKTQDLFCACATQSAYNTTVDTSRTSSSVQTLRIAPGRSMTCMIARPIGLLHRAIANEDLRMRVCLTQRAMSSGPSPKNAAFSVIVPSATATASECFTMSTFLRERTGWAQGDRGDLAARISNLNRQDFRRSWEWRCSIASNPIAAHAARVRARKPLGLLDRALIAKHKLVRPRDARAQVAREQIRDKNGQRR